MKTVITIQHTQSLHHTNGMVGSWTDWELTDLGRKQAEAIGEKLSRELQGNTFVMYSSDLARAKQTAEIVGRHLGIVPSYDMALRERNLGKCVGKSVQWLKEHMECEEKTIDDRMFSDAESKRDEWNRLLPFFQKIMSGKEEHIILVAHGDLLSVFNAMWLKFGVEDLTRIDLYGSAGGVSHMIERDDGKRVIRRLSDMSYFIP